MTKDQLKKRLKTYRHLENERQQIERNIERIEAAMASPRGPNMDAMPRSPGAGDPILAVVAQHMELLDQYTLQLGRLAAAQADIEDLISSLTDPRHRMVLRAHYIDCLKWEDVCTAVNYGWSQVHNFHSQALTALLEMEARHETD